MPLVGEDGEDLPSDTEVNEQEALQSNAEAIPEIQVLMITSVVWVISLCLCDNLFVLLYKSRMTMRLTCLKLPRGLLKMKVMGHSW